MSGRPSTSPAPVRPSGTDVPEAVKPLAAATGPRRTEKAGTIMALLASLLPAQYCSELVALVKQVHAMHKRHFPSLFGWKFRVAVATVAFAWIVGFLTPRDSYFHPSSGSCVGKLQKVWLCPSDACVCDPPRVDGGGCVGGAIGCNAGGLGQNWRFLQQMSEKDQKDSAWPYYPRTCALPEKDGQAE